MKWCRIVLCSVIAGLMFSTIEAFPRSASAEVATNTQTTEVVIIPGRQSLIEFRNGETIQFISLADVHQIVFSTDLPIASGQASVIVLRSIEPLRLKGVVETPTTGNVRQDYPNETIYPTNLVVITSTPTGQKRTYTFDLRISLSPVPRTSTEIAIGSPESSSGQQSLILADGRRASWRDIEWGYAIALRENYTNSRDPVVKKIQSFLDLARQNVPFLEAAQRVGLPFEVVEALAEIGLNATQEVKSEKTR